MSKTSLSNPNLVVYDRRTQSDNWLCLAKNVLANDRETYDMLTILFREYHKQTLDYEGLINAVGGNF
jgi:histone deacetylase complex regulatory component SIN3